jgi:hypothetical protein
LSAGFFSPACHFPRPPKRPEWLLAGAFTFQVSATGSRGQDAVTRDRP